MVGPEKGVWERADLAPDAVCIDCGGKAVVPGFVDPHTHAVFAGTREGELAMKLRGATYLDILSSGGGILRTVRETRPLDVLSLTRELERHLDIMMAYGTTCAEVKSGYGLTTESELDLLKAVRASNHPVERVATFMGPHAVPPEYSGRSEDFLELMTSLLPTIKEQGLADFADIFCEKGVFTPEQSRRFLTAAKDAGLGTKIHSDEIENLGGTVLGAGLGAKSADHLLVSGEKDLLALEASGTVPVLLPATLLTLFEEKIPPVKRMLELGLPIALATDLNPNCMCHSMQFVMALACYRLRMTPHQVLAASTVNAAKAIGLDHRKGRLAPGFDADLLVLKEGSFDHVVYQMGTNHVDTVIIGGRCQLSGVRH
jgi:imidazolonepropionase